MDFNLKKLFWSVLLSSGQPVSPKKFQEFIHRSFSDRFMALSELKVAVEEMNVELAAREAPEMIAEGPDGYYIRLHAPYAEAARTYKGEPTPQKMSAAALETLSIIAYRQPITRAQMEAIRGVSCDGPVAKLVELELIAGRQNENLPGRPTEFSTTSKFLQISGIRDLGELPQSEATEDERLREFFKKADAVTGVDKAEANEKLTEKQEVVEAAETRAS